MYSVLLILCMGIAVYLMYVLINPEKF
ncbi:K(+)-transporting ATPase subunit F [Macellibacteroides sp.]|nr:K(+)-transporting ATPase subunit F [Macellibacteroides fermentans]